MNEPDWELIGFFATVLALGLLFLMTLARA